MAAALNALRSAFAGISPRERRLLLAVGGLVAVLVLGGLWYWSSSVLDDIETERADLVDALRTIRNERPRIRQRQEQHERMLARYANRAPPLTSFVETAAHDANVQVAEATDRNTPPAPGARFQKRSVSIRLRHVDLQSLVAFMERIDAATFPIAITSMRVHKRFGESNSYDVDDMVITTWDRIEPPRRGASSGAGAGASGTSRTAGSSGASTGSRQNPNDELGGAR
jgi:hypothetical protein